MVDFFAAFFGVAFFAAFLVVGFAATDLAAFFTDLDVDLVVAVLDAGEEAFLPPNAADQPAAYFSLVPTRVMVTGLTSNPIV